METVTIRTEIAPDGKLRIEVPTHLPPGPAEVAIVIRPASADVGEWCWRDFYGLGREIWQDEDAQQYVNRLREEWQRDPA